MYQPEQELPPPQVQLSNSGAARELYLSAAELLPTESLPLEFSDVRAAPGGRGFDCPGQGGQAV